MSPTSLEKMLDKGSFETTILSLPTKVDYKIYSDYRIKADFTSHGTPYTFEMLRWRKTKDGITKARITYNQFALLVLQVFWPESDVFGKLDHNSNPDQTDEEVLATLRYAMIDVFKCAEQILAKHKRSFLDYCLYHRAQDKDKT